MASKLIYYSREYIGFIRDVVNIGGFMLELRWFKFKHKDYELKPEPEMVLQYRETEFSNEGVIIIQDWVNVPTIFEGEL